MTTDQQPHPSVILNMSNSPKPASAPATEQYAVPLEMEAQCTVGGFTQCAPWEPKSRTQPPTHLARLIARQPRSDPPLARWTVLSWKARGMTAARLLEIETWVRRCHDRRTVHICVRLEAHWGFESEWEISDYHILHTGLSKRREGYLRSSIRLSLPARPYDQLPSCPEGYYRSGWTHCVCCVSDDLERRVQAGGKHDAWHSVSSCGPVWTPQLRECRSDLSS